MASGTRYLIDTNVLLRLSKRDDPVHSSVRAAVASLAKDGAELCCTPQNVFEFWNVCTRPRTANGFGLSVKEADTRVLTIEDTMTMLPDNEQIYPEWRRLVARNNVRGVQVHDARLAAAMRIHGVSYILTLNQPDFVRYTSITALLPQDVR